MKRADIESNLLIQFQPQILSWNTVQQITHILMELTVFHALEIVIGRYHSQNVTDALLTHSLT